MTRTTGRLTALKVERLKSKSGMHADGGGLYLQVTPGGASCVLRYMLNGKAREMGLGPLALYGLADARAKALDARRLRHEGIGPIEHRRAEKAARALSEAKGITFKQCAERRSDGARLPQYLPHLGRRAHQFPTRGDRGRSCAHGRQ